MEWTYNKALAGVLEHEGGYSNDPSDDGGPTNHGITIEDVRRYLNPSATENDVKALTVDQAKTIIKQHYANPIRYDDLPAGIDYAVLDYGITSGIRTAVASLQRIVGATPTDGIVGPVTIGLANGNSDPASASKVINALCDERMVYLKTRKNWKNFGKGWTQRVADVRADALAMADTITGTVVVPIPIAVPKTWPLQSECLSFYGDPRKSGWLQANTTHVACPWPLHMDGGVTVHDILIHKKCADSLARVLGAIWDAVGQDAAKIHALRYDVFDGSYNLRVMRGGASLSMHSFACAIDWDAADNQQHSQHHLFTSQSLIVMKFKEEQWIWGGDWSPGSIDSMHVQASRIHN